MTIVDDHGMDVSVKTMGIAKFKATCLSVLNEVGKTGKPLLITKRGEPVAQILPPPAQQPGSWLGSLAGSGEIVGDLILPPIKAKDWKATRK